MTSTSTTLELGGAEPSSEHAGLRLAPIDRPRSWIVRLFFWFSRLRLGKVMMPARVIYARWTGLLWAQLPLYWLVQSGLSIGQELRHLLEVQISLSNGCTFCIDLHRADAQLQKLARAKFDAIARYESDAIFSARERAALRYAQELAGGRVAEPVFADLRAHFSEREIVEITWLCAFTTYLNRMAVPLGIGSDGFCELVSARGGKRGGA
jgi:AhpD family alkylhydroperoxidase